MWLSRRTGWVSAPARALTGAAGAVLVYSVPMAEIFYTTLLALATILITWFSVYVVYRAVTNES